jgi:hypothetical protein
MGYYDYGYGYGGQGPPIVYRGRVTGLRISAVDGGVTESGGAFVDNFIQTYTDFTCNLSTVAGTAFITNPSIDLSRFAGMKLTLTAGGKTLVGWGKAAGSPTGETLTQTAPDPTFVDLTGVPYEWNASDGWSVSGGKGRAVAGSASLIMYALSLDYVTAAIGSLYKSMLTIDSISGSFHFGYNQTDKGPAYTTVGTKTEYKTVTDTGYTMQGIYRDSPTDEGVFDNQNKYIVSTPSANASPSSRHRVGQQGTGRAMTGLIRTQHPSL